MRRFSEFFKHPDKCRSDLTSDFLFPSRSPSGPVASSSKVHTVLRFWPVSVRNPQNTSTPARFANAFRDPSQGPLQKCIEYYVFDRFRSCFPRGVILVSSGFHLGPSWRALETVQDPFGPRGPLQDPFRAPSVPAKTLQSECESRSAAPPPKH